MKNKNEKKFLNTSFTALLAGVGLGVLFAPQSGRRTRKEIERLGRKSKDLFWDFQESLKENVAKLTEDIAEVTRDSLERGKELTEEKKKKILEMIEAGEQLLSPKKEKLDKLFKFRKDNK